MAIGPVKTRSGLSRYRDANAAPTSPLADDIATAPSGPVSILRHVVVIYT